MKPVLGSRAVGATIVFALFSTASFVAASALRRSEAEAMNREVEAATQGIRSEIVSRIDARIQSLVRMARRWAFRRPDYDSWEYEASLVYTDYPGFQLIEWVDTDHHVRWLVPRDETNAKARDLYLPFEPRRKAALDRSLRTRTVSFTRPLDLVIGGRGFLALSPILVEDSVQGFILGVFRAEKLFDAVLAEMMAAPSYALRILDGDEPLYARGPAPSAETARFEHRASIRQHGIDWTLVVRPSEATLAARATGLSEATLGLGHAIAALLGLTLYFSGRARERARRAEQAEAKLQEAVRELEAFGYTVSHDLRAPLRAMAGFTGFMLEEYGRSLDEQARDYLRRIDAASRKMDVMIRELLAYSQLSRVHVRRTPVDTATVAREVVEALAADAPGGRADIAVEGELPPVMGDPLLLSQCLTNLLSNALKFVPAERPARVRLRAQEAGSRVRLWVEDNGLGIALEHRERIFRVFERLHRQEEYPGTGIGLAIVQRAAERMGGAVGVESDLGQGSRFWIELDRG